MKILIQFPTLARPTKFLRALEEYLTLSSGMNTLFFNVNCDYYDSTMRNMKTLETATEMIKERPYVDGSFNFTKHSNKIQAVNACIENVDFDVVMCASDDMLPVIYGWDVYISEAMSRYFPDLDGCLHFNDGNTGNKLITLSILGKKLYDHFGYIYHPDYKSLYCDDEFTQEVYRLDKVRYIDIVIIKHEHYSLKGNSNSGQFDEAARKTLSYSGRDKIVFEARKKRGFPKERITVD